MAITKDRSNLPPGDSRSGIVPMADSPLVADLLAGLETHITAWRAAAYGGDGDDRPMSREGAVFRHSDAAGCARQLGYKMAKVPFTDEATVVDKVNMFWGTVIHDHVDKALHAAGWPEDAVEVPCGFDEPVRTAGTADGFHDGVCVETKSVGGYKFKLAVGERGEAAGPDWGAIVQGSLNAEALGADEMVILDVAKELISKPTAARKGIPDEQRGIAAWHYKRTTRILYGFDAEGGPVYRTFPEIAQNALRWVKKVHDLVTAGESVPAAIDDPEIPSSARIVDPSTGRWVVSTKDGSVLDSGNYWGCGYCWHRSHCAAAMAAEKAEAA